MMLKKMIQLPAFKAGDETLIREVLHPKNEDLSLPYSLAHATLAPGEASQPHRLQNSTEVYVILEGRGTVFIEERAKAVVPGDVLLIPAGAEQYVVNTGSTALYFLCIVSPPWQKDDEIIG